MVRSGGESPTESGANLMPASVPDLARSLRLARERAELTVGDAAARAGLSSAVVEALESGNVGTAPRPHRHPPISAGLRRLARPARERLRPRRGRAVAGGRPLPPLGGETAVVPVVSISSAPAGGHFPAGGYGSVWPGDATGVTDATTTGVMETRPTSLNDTGRLPALDTGRVPAVDTGQVRAVNVGAPRLLKFMVGLLTVLVVLGAAALIERGHLNGWFDSGKSTTTRWVDDAKSALGITSSTPGHGHHATTTPTTAAKAIATSKVAMQAGPGLSERITVAATSFTVKVVATKGPCWVSVATAPGLTPLFEGDLQPGQSHSFVVTSSLTVQTGSAAGGTLLYEGIKPLGFFFPPKAPFTINFTATGGSAG